MMFVIEFLAKIQILTAENECGSDTHVSEEGSTSVVYNKVGYE